MEEIQNIIEILSVSNPVRINDNVINCIVLFSHLNEEIEFSATSYDTSLHGIKLWTDLNNGVYGIVQEQSIQISKVDIDNYRDYLIDSGIIFNSHAIQTRSQDRENISGACTLATIAIMNGAQKGNYNWNNGELFQWICEDNSVVNLDAFELINLGKSIATYKQQCIFTARTLKDMIDLGNTSFDYKSAEIWPNKIFNT